VVASGSGYQRPLPRPGRSASFGRAPDCFRPVPRWPGGNGKGAAT
jgi:hypothetical protein